MRKPSVPPTPRLADGTPNLGSLTPKGAWELHRHVRSEEMLADPKENIPYQPWAKALKDYRRSLFFRDDPAGLCLPIAGTRAVTTPSAMEFVQQPEHKRIVVIYEGGTQKWRTVHMDGRPHPRYVSDAPTWVGHAIGRWEGDTLVVDTVGYNEGQWVDGEGSPRTNLHHVIERFTRLDYNTLEHEATIDDPGAYTRPWTLRHIIQFNPELEISDTLVCQENNRWLELRK